MRIEEINNMSNEALSPGARLRQARIEKNLELEQVAHQLRLSKQQLEAIEADDFTYMPRLAYIRGHLRMYAKLVDLSPNEVLKAFESLGMKDTEFAPVAMESTPLDKRPLVAEEGNSNPLVWWSVGAVIILAVLLYASFHWHSGHKLAKKSSTAVSAEPVVANPNDTGTPIPLNIPDNNPVTESLNPPGATTSAVTPGEQSTAPVTALSDHAPDTQQAD